MVKRLIALGVLALACLAPTMADELVWEQGSTFGHNNDLHRNFRIYMIGFYFKDSRGWFWVKDQVSLRLQHQGSKSGKLTVSLDGNGWATNKSGYEDASHTWTLSAGDKPMAINRFSDDPGTDVLFVHYEDDDNHNTTGPTIHADQTPPDWPLVSSANDPGTNALLPAPVLDAFGKGWHRQFIIAHAEVSGTDAGSGIATMERQINGTGPWESVAFSQLTADNRATMADVSNAFLVDGDHTITVRSTDHVGNVNPGKTIHYYVDTTKPVFGSGRLTVNLTGSTAATPYQTLRLIWPQADDPVVNNSRSGFRDYTVSINNTEVATITNPATTSFDYGTVGQPLSSIFDRRSQDNGILVSVKVTDHAGNETILEYDTVDKKFVLPKLVSPLAFGSAVLAPTDSNPNPLSKTLVTLPLNVTPQAFATNYSQITLARRGTSDFGTSIDTDVVIVPQQVVAADGTILDPEHWRTYINPQDLTQPYLEYREELEPWMGIGGKTATYTIAHQSVVGHPLEGVGTSQSLDLPAHPGQMLIQVLDMEGNSITVHRDGTMTDSGKALVVDASGRVQVRFEGLGIDQDDWTVGVYQLVPQKINENVTIIQEFQLGGAANNDLRYRYDPATYDFETHRYQAKTIPITLSYGDTNIQIKWVQDADKTRALQYSRLVTLSFELTFDGRFRLALSSPLSPTVRRQDDGAIVIAPGQGLSFNLSGQGDDSMDLSQVHWDFGDQAYHSAQSTSPSWQATGSAVSHIYDQVPGKTTDSTTHTLTVSNLPGGSPPASFPVVVLDTQDGQLYQSEVWNGPHTVSGRVVVPEGMSLAIGTQTGASTSVTLAGGLAANLSQGIQAQGTLRIGMKPLPAQEPSGVRVWIGPDPDAPSATGQRWGGIFVTGDAHIANATIEGADRGVVATSSSTVTLTGTQLIENVIGLHALGNAAVTMSGGRVADSSAYGIKEDAGAAPLLVGNQFENNAQDYYQDGVAGISLADLNRIHGNSGNQ